MVDVTGLLTEHVQHISERSTFYCNHTWPHVHCSWPLYHNLAHICTFTMQLGEPHISMDDQCPTSKQQIYSR